MEANTIGTTALRARLLPETHRAETVRLLREYVQIRLDVISSGRSGKIGMQLIVPTRSKRNFGSKQWQWPPRTRGLYPGLFIQALNETIDNQEVRLTALRNQVPNIVPQALTPLLPSQLGLQVMRAHSKRGAPGSPPT